MDEYVTISYFGDRENSKSFVYFEILFICFVNHYIFIFDK